ncbi:AcrR family transcriptional regulator [Kineosphaera limosa]|uniref:Putative TetR family transcriptional regulator n=1 Tax=Kineosphaera limosa NBRC 100340 TaxID=1184609 RepID=K6VMU9_9MICO|nr:TetR/AcrR family transcriptional regulator [Kineosphaera limosa]NYE00472.1 AcrR family transcriptional regulator [Kineosphaera limosa]GAB97553.1 putative TetR family transcriptional regulator [Kineosphaera limosa NBRC 100340]
MARPKTVERVYAAVLALAERGGPNALTMEGIAAEAGASKQTLYRNWPSVHALLFDALAAESATPDAPTGDVTVVELLRAAIDEISEEPRASLLRMLAASIQTDEVVAQQFRERLLEPQLAQITRLVAAAGYPSSRESTELLLAPIFYRWFLRLPQLRDDELRANAERILALDQGPSINAPRRRD